MEARALFVPQENTKQGQGPRHVRTAQQAHTLRCHVDHTTQIIAQHVHKEMAQTRVMVIAAGTMRVEHVKNCPLAPAQAA